ncbi:unnamed protein product [Rotaria sordida]|uniref:Uncharacterized protein n=1 Tax=Rotaria sordida TaxID=392033 RepID=A0A818ULY1_9BILA|nr:unnamed protein product [Rotaria sordida]CAF1066233.1 unnamed protein product [Rotaria sordida]CAF1124585.1 unnamed protein product [Rotaria sordida]CAF3504777.1 unnamed protein product [Rotaria sordida]CAF3693582.1 unnamed protein product [Rotaria sordida]
MYEVTMSTITNSDYDSLIAIKKESISIELILNELQRKSQQKKCHYIFKRLLSIERCMTKFGVFYPKRFWLELFKLDFEIK